MQFQSSIHSLIHRLNLTSIQLCLYATSLDTVYLINTVISTCILNNNVFLWLYLRDFLIWHVSDFPSSIIRGTYPISVIVARIVRRRSRSRGRQDERSRQRGKINKRSSGSCSRDGEIRERAARGFLRRALMELSLAFALAIGDASFLSHSLFVAGEAAASFRPDQRQPRRTQKPRETHCNRLRKRVRTEQSRRPLGPWRVGRYFDSN